jgi:hypothetical protein
MGNVKGETGIPQGRIDFILKLMANVNSKMLK